MRTLLARLEALSANEAAVYRLKARLLFEHEDKDGVDEFADDTRFKSLPPDAVDAYLRAMRKAVCSIF